MNAEKVESTPGSGVFCVSVDVEMAWGVWDTITAATEHMIEEADRPVLRRLIDLFDRYDVPATWAVVGRLIGEPSKAPGRVGPAWHAPEIMEWLRAAATRHDIGSHSFEHIYFGEISAQRTEDDLGAACETHRKLGLNFDSFVFPRNQVNHLPILACSGIKVYRSVDAGMVGAIGKGVPRLRPVANLIDKMLPLAPPTVSPKADSSGMTELESSMLLMGRNGARRIIRPQIILMKHKLGLHKAARSGSVFHLWFHPSNFYYSTEQQFDVLDRTLREAARLRAEGQLEIRTMANLAIAA